MNLAIFGGGSIGQRHARNARTLGHDVEIFDHENGRGLELSAFRPNVDAVLICTPAGTHGDVAEELLRTEYRGPLFCEKPLMLTVDDAPVFLEWPHQVTMVGYNWRFHPEIAPLAELARRGSTVHFDCRTDMRIWPGKAYGDPLLECSHDVDTACAWLGDPTSITGGELTGSGAWLQMQHPHGSSIVDVCWHEDDTRRSVTLYLGVTQVRVDMRRRVLEAATRAWPALDESYVLELQHFLDCVRTGQPTVCPFSQGLRVVEICEQVKELQTV